MLKGQVGFIPANNERNSENHALQPGQINNASGIGFIYREEFIMYLYVLLAMGVQCVIQHLGQSLLLLQLNNELLVCRSNIILIQFIAVLCHKSQK